VRHLSHGANEVRQSWSSKLHPNSRAVRNGVICNDLNYIEEGVRRFAVE
jgi:hypothetical protein